MATSRCLARSLTLTLLFLVLVPIRTLGSPTIGSSIFRPAQEYSISFDIETCAYVFDPPQKSDALFDALRICYPTIENHDLRTRQAIADHWIRGEQAGQELSQCLSTEPVLQASRRKPSAPSPAPLIIYKPNAGLDNSTYQLTSVPDYGLPISRPRNPLDLLPQAEAKGKERIGSVPELVFSMQIDGQWLPHKRKLAKTPQQSKDYKYARRHGVCEKHGKIKKKCDPDCPFRNRLSAFAEFQQDEKGPGATGSCHANVSSAFDDDFGPGPDARIAIERLIEKFTEPDLVDEDGVFKLDPGTQWSPDTETLNSVNEVMMVNADPDLWLAFAEDQFTNLNSWSGEDSIEFSLLVLDNRIPTDRLSEQISLRLLPTPLVSSIAPCATGTVPETRAVSDLRPVLRSIPSNGGAAYRPATSYSQELMLPPDTRSISQERLVEEVESIYAGLGMVEEMIMTRHRACEEERAGQYQATALFELGHLQASIEDERQTCRQHFRGLYAEMVASLSALSNPNRSANEEDDVEIASTMRLRYERSSNLAATFTARLGRAKVHSLLVQIKDALKRLYREGTVYDRPKKLVHLAIAFVATMIVMFADRPPIAQSAPVDNHHGSTSASTMRSILARLVDLENSFLQMRHAPSELVLAFQRVARMLRRILLGNLESSSQGPFPLGRESILKLFDWVR